MFLQIICGLACGATVPRGPAKVAELATAVDIRANAGLTCSASTGGGSEAPCPRNSCIGGGRCACVVSADWPRVGFVTLRRARAQPLEKVCRIAVCDVENLGRHSCGDRDEPLLPTSEPKRQKNVNGRTDPGQPHLLAAYLQTTLGLSARQTADVHLTSACSVHAAIRVLDILTQTSRQSCGQLVNHTLRR